MVMTRRGTPVLTNITYTPRQQYGTPGAGTAAHERSILQEVMSPTPSGGDNVSEEAEEATIRRRLSPEFPEPAAHSLGTGPTGGLCDSPQSVASFRNLPDRVQAAAVGIPTTHERHRLCSHC